MSLMRLLTQAVIPDLKRESYYQIEKLVGTSSMMAKTVANVCGTGKRLLSCTIR